MTIENSYYGVYWREGVANSQIFDSNLRNCQYNIYLFDGARDILIDGCDVGPTQRFNPSDSSNNIHTGVSPPEWNPIQNVGITITNNEVHDGYTQGIAIFHCDDVIVRGNHCHRNGATGIQIEANAANGVTSRVVVEDNVAENNSQRFSAETGIWVDDSDLVVVQNNVIFGNETGLYVTGTYNSISRFNTIYENHHANPGWINAYGVGVRGSPNGRESVDNAIVHNTLHRNSANSQRPQVVLGLHPPLTDAPVERTRFKNNISSECLDNLDLWIRGFTQTLDYNDYYEVGGLPVVRWQESTISWASYLAISGQDENSITADPMFVDAAAANFQLDPASPCVDAGDFLTTTTSAGSGTVVPVADAAYFTDGMGLIDGDDVRIGSEFATVTGVDYAANTLTLDRSITWIAGDGVTYPYAGARPDMGAYEWSDVVHVPDAGASRTVLRQNVPNPFNPRTRIPFVLDAGGHVEVRIYDSSGAVVRRLLRRELSAGTHAVTWAGRTDRGSPVGSGVYFYELFVDGERIESRKALLLK